MDYMTVKQELQNIKISLKTALKHYFVQKKFQEIQKESDNQAKKNIELVKKMGITKIKKFSKSTSSQG